MSKFRATVTYPDGYEEILEDLFDSDEEAREAALYAISCWDVGAEGIHRETRTMGTGKDLR